MPIETEEDIIRIVRLAVTDDEDLLPTSVIEAFISIHEDKYSLEDNSCYLTHYVILSSFDNIKKRLLKDGEGIAGGVFREMEGKLQYENSNYGDKGAIDYWDDLKNDYLKNSELYLPCLSKYSSNLGIIKIGGVRTKEVVKVQNDCDRLKNIEQEKYTRYLTNKSIFKKTKH